MHMNEHCILTFDIASNGEARLACLEPGEFFLLLDLDEGGRRLRQVPPVGQILHGV